MQAFTIGDRLKAPETSCLPHLCWRSSSPWSRFALSTEWQVGCGLRFGFGVGVGRLNGLQTCTVLVVFTKRLRGTTSFLGRMINQVPIPLDYMKEFEKQ